MNKLDNFTNEELIEILNISKSFKEVVTKIGYNYRGGAGYAAVKRTLKLRNINIPKYYVSEYTGGGKKYELTDILIENSPYTYTNSLKHKLIKLNLLENKCSKCGNRGIWNNEKLVLHLEHKNGDNCDNRLENLTILCPNCHSQTKTYAGKNTNKKDPQRYKNRIEYLELRRKLYSEKHEIRKNIILNANIDFSKFGWVVKIAELLDMKYQKIRPWMMKQMPDFYENKCFKR